jgi:hypothetical protein
MTSREHKPGSGSLFRNRREEMDRQPDYNGSIVLPDGTEHWLSGWLKDGKQGKYMSLSLGEPKKSDVQRQLDAGKRLHGMARVGHDTPF